MTDDDAFPDALAELAAVTFPYKDDLSIDYEPFPRFDTAEETTDWLRAWTGNADADGSLFRLFGRDGTGGHAAFWLCRDGVPVTGQPVVFLGSEGRIGVVATNLGDLLWLLADGCGPYEAVKGLPRPSQPRADLTAIAERHAGGAPRPAADILADAQRMFPDFEALIEDMCR